MKQKFGIYIAGETQSWIMNDGKPGHWEAELDDIMEFASREAAQTWLDENGGGGPLASIIEIENIYEL